jgi:hypothetical protein
MSKANREVKAVYDEEHGVACRSNRLESMAYEQATPYQWNIGELPYAEPVRKSLCHFSELSA